MKNKVKVWLNFDFGFSADYENLYYFLNKIKAKEYGDTLAYFETEYKKDFIKSLKKQLLNEIKLKKNDRIYLIIMYKEKLLSGFILGNQKSPAWQGFSQKENFNILIEDI